MTDSVYYYEATLFTVKEILESTENTGNLFAMMFKGSDTKSEKLVKYITFKSDKDNKDASRLCEMLRKVTKLEGLYSSVVIIKQSELIKYYNQIKKEFVKDSTYGKELVEYLGKEHDAEIAAANKMISKGLISFDNLNVLFQLGTKCLSSLQKSIVGFNIIDSYYTNDNFVLKGYIVIYLNGLYLRLTTFRIGKFDGVVDIKDLPVIPLDDKMELILKHRGLIFKSICVANKTDNNKGYHYSYYSGNMYIVNEYNFSDGPPEECNINGNIIIDGTMFLYYRPRYSDKIFYDEEKSRSLLGSSTKDSDQIIKPLIQITELSDDQLFMTSPFLYGFAMNIEEWGYFNLENMQEIKYDLNAFDKLVLKSDMKQIIKTLVEKTDTSTKVMKENKDNKIVNVIDNKSDGLIFLLHGDPGVGKTLTAEAVAHHLHRPLYHVNIGTLYARPQELEKELRKIMNITTRWNSIILIDEADVFMERRDKQMERNVIVAIFLKCLEYFHGIMFLTTNRITEFDEAFYSRITLAIYYEPSTDIFRQDVWRTLLVDKINGDKSNISLSTDDIKLLSKYDLNGRQIKNVIRLVKILNTDKIVCDDIIKIIELVTDFKKHINN